MEYQALLEECENCGFPVKDGEALELELGWECAFERDGQMMIRSNVRHERICVLFNIAALESYQASKEDLTTKEGLLSAVKKYNACAGIFRRVRTDLLFPPPDHDPDPSNDLSPSCLEMCEKVVSAQAQACVYDTARIHTKAHPSLLAKLAMGAAELFGEALLLGSERRVRSRTTRASPWLLRLKARSADFRAAAELHEAETIRRSDEPGSHGVEIARLRATERLCDDGVSLAGRGSCETTNLVALKRLATQRRIAAERDNQSLYRDIVPRTLRPTPGHRMAKPTFPSEELSPSAFRPFTTLK